MLRNLKALGLALVAVFAMSAIAASTASAQTTDGELTSDGPVTLRGVNAPLPAANVLTAVYGGEASEVKCPNVHYTGHTDNTTPHVAIKTPVTDVTLTADYKVCTANELPATVDMNGCDYTLELTDTAASPADTYNADVYVVCPAGQHIQVTVFSGGTHAFRVCTITIEHKATAYTGLTVTDNTNGTLRLSGSAPGIKATRSGLCGGGTDENAKLDLDVNVTGLDSKGKATTISVTH